MLTTQRLACSKAGLGRAAAEDRTGGLTGRVGGCHGRRDVQAAGRPLSRSPAAWRASHGLHRSQGHDVDEERFATDGAEPGGGW